MATLLDVGALSFFLPIFVFIFIFSALLALLEKTKILGGEKSRVLNVAAAFSIAAISIFAGRLTGLISIIVPWIVFVFILLLLIFMVFGFFNVEHRQIWDLFGEVVVFIVILIIVLVGITVVFEGTVSPYGGGDPTAPGSATNPRTETLRTLTHPRLLGALFTLVVASSAVTYLTKKVEAGK